MKTQNVNTTSNRLVKALRLCAIVLPLSVAVSGNAKAEECQPLQVSSMRPFNAHISSTGSMQSVSFYVDGYVQNRNPGVYNGSSRAWLNWYYRTNSGQTVGLQQETFSTHIAPRNGKQRIVGNTKYKVTGNSYPSWIVTFEGVIVNEQCSDPKKRFARTVVRYDLNPVRSGGKPKLILRGAPRILLDSATRAYPRPRPGTGAPKPRT